MKIIEIIESVRVYCSRPPHDTLDNGAILTVLQGRIDFYRGLMTLTDRDWVVDDFFLEVNANETEYTIPVGNMSRPIKVEYFDPAAPWRNGPEIPIVLLQDSDLVGQSDIFLYNSGGSTGGRIDVIANEGSFIASALAFYNFNTQIRVIPRPYQPVTYRVFYEPSSIDPPGLLDEPKFPQQFHDMLALGTAQICLGMAKLDPDMAMSLGQGIAEGLARHEKAFNDYRRLSKHADTRRRRPFRPSWNRGGYK